MSSEKTCFVVCPIGSEGSDIRARSDKFIEHIVHDVVDEFGYNIVRANEMSEPGSITTQIIEKVVESDLVIADLTGHNPNVFYELALRHSTAKPYIQMIDSSENIPFDISDLRTIYYDFDVSSASKAKEKIREQLEMIEEEEPTFDNPISQSADLKSWRESEDPIQQNLADILDGIRTLNNRIDDTNSKIEDLPYRTKAQPRYSKEPFEFTKPIELGNRKYRT